MPADPADDSIIDVTGMVLKLKEAFCDQLVDFAKADQAHPTPAPNLSNAHPYYDYEPPSLAKFYRQKLALTPKQTSWLNRFPLPHNTFLDIEAGREAAVRLYLGVLPLLELQLRAEGSTLAQTVKTLDSRAKSLRYYASTAWYYTPPKTGADTYLAIFRLCENAVRERLGYKRKVGGLFGGALAELEPVFEEILGQRVRALLPPLLALLPAPDAETELLLNEQNPSRWKAELEQLLAAPAAPAALLPALAGLVARNARNPSLGLLHLELARRLAPRHREAALGYVLRHLHHAQTRFGEAKPLPKNLHKQLFPEAGAAERFQQLVNELALYKNLDDALAKVPAVYTAPRKKIELNRAAIRAARSQHAGTVELLNEYLRDDDAPATPPPPPPAKPKATKEVKAAKAPKALRSPKLAKTAAPAALAAGEFAAGLALTDAQQALLLLFAARGLALPQAEVEAFAQRYGTLRNQLIDGINDACHELLDDVLIEESGDDYTIYEVYYRRLTS